jgi:hypothetical protein
MKNAGLSPAQAAKSEDSADCDVSSDIIILFKHFSLITATRRRR